jgi:carboxyl-terminal processing protease
MLSWRGAWIGARDIARVTAVAAALVGVASCGGGGGGSSVAPSGVMAQTCSPNNPFRGDATSATALGNIGTEKTWLRDYFDRNYLWYNEVPNVNASAPNFSNEADVYASLDNYFNALLTPATTASGKLRDQFSFTYPTAARRSATRCRSRPTSRH